LWPIMRFFDPRFQGIAAQLSVSHDDLAARIHTASQELGASVADVDRLLRAEIEAATDATTLLGEALSDIRQSVDTFLRHAPDAAIEAYVERLSERDVTKLDPIVARLLNRAEGHQGFAAQRNLWFNSPLTLSYMDGDVAVGEVNERAVELPYVLRALAAVPRGASILDVGATESLLSLWLASLGYHVTAIDPRPYPLSHPRLDVVAEQVQRWKPGRTFDAVVCLSTIEHIGLGAYGEEQQDERADLDAMARMRDSAAPGGLLVLTTPYGAARVDALTRVYDRSGLDELLAGWEVTDLTIARRESRTSWLADNGDQDTETESEAVALVTARRADR
jgi:SAM-dependent methyltransferase